MVVDQKSYPTRNKTSIYSGSAVMVVISYKNERFQNDLCVSALIFRWRLRENKNTNQVLLCGGGVGDVCKRSASGDGRILLVRTSICE